VYNVNSTQAAGYINKLSISIIDSVSGNYSTIVEGLTSPNEYGTITKYNGFTTSSTQVTISGSPFEMWYTEQLVYSHVTNLNSTETYPLSSLPNLTSRIIKPETSRGPHSFILAQPSSDYTIDDNYITAINPITVTCVVSSNPLLPPDTIYRLP
jgi:hypothetical protein